MMDMTCRLILTHIFNIGDDFYLFLKNKLGIKYFLFYIMNNVINTHDNTYESDKRFILTVTYVKNKINVAQE